MTELVAPSVPIDALAGLWDRLLGLVGLESPVVVGCSGGPDSTTLLAVAVAAGLDPVAVHVDHGLRDDSTREVDVVARLAEGLGASFLARSMSLELVAPTC